MKRGLTPARDLRPGDVVWLWGDEVLVERIDFDSQQLLNVIYRSPTGEQKSMRLLGEDMVALASGWSGPPAELSLQARVALRGAPFGAVIVVLAILGMLMHLPWGGGLSFLIVVLWLVGVVRMVTTPERRR
jgi:hypothetical protein